MNMKYSRLMVAVENKSGGFWQVALSDEEQQYVINLISQLHGGTVKILNNKLPLEFEGKKKSAA